LTFNINFGLEIYQADFYVLGKHEFVFKQHLQPYLTQEKYKNNFLPLISVYHRADLGEKGEMRRSTICGCRNEKKEENDFVYSPHYIAKDGGKLTFFLILFCCCFS
jgi:hypothetical protein